MRERVTPRTGDPKNDPWPAQSTGIFIPILKHLDHPIHLPSGVRYFIMFDIELVLVGAANLEHSVPGVIGVACNHIELSLTLVQNELVQERLLCAWRCLC